jgi:F-type H+-transporting ATPase subunit alpha
MVLGAEETSWAIQQRIKQFESNPEPISIGRVLQVGDDIARVWGLDDVMMSELVEFPNGVMGMVLNLEVENVGVIVLGSDIGIKEHDVVKRTGKCVTVPCGEALLGRVVDALGNPIDGKGEIRTEHRRLLEWPAPNVVARQPVNEPVQTGIKAIDSMIPIGRGQRELIIGDRQTGKTTTILDTIINQKEKGNHCFYVAIGQKTSTVSQVVQILQEAGAMEYTTVVAASAAEPPSLQYIAPYTGTAMGEYFMYGGRHAICFYDDLTKHAAAYRQLALLLRRPPGREAYPGDVFYLHSRLLERSAKLNEELGGGSLTGIPVIETQANDVAAYIPTNVISITDGQIYLESDLFFAGIRPAVNVGLSASRVGGKAQTEAMKKVAGRLRLDLAQYRDLVHFAQFGSDLDAATKAQLVRGERMVELLKQDKLSPIPLERQVMILFIGVNGLLDDQPLHVIHAFEQQFYHFVDERYPEIPKSIRDTQKLDAQVAEKLNEVAKEFKALFTQKQEGHA